MVGEVSERIAVSRTSALPQDLKPRIASGLVMAAVALAGNWAGPVPFAVMVAGVAIVMSWEWGRVVRHTPFDRGLVVHAMTATAAIALVASGRVWLALGAVAAGALAMLMVRVRANPLTSAIGVLYVGLPAVALVWLRAAEPHGAAAILFVYTIVWTTDTFAYVCGRLIGGPKLWPALSPRKTWAGTLGGIVFAAAAALAFAFMLPGTTPLALAGTGVVLSAVTQAGDLAESALKRAFLVEHASQLIPGHGGFMDRMDGIVAAATIAALLAAARNADAPAQALLF